MASYGYDSQLGDIIRPLGQGDVQTTEYNFRKVPNVEITANAEQNRVDTHTLATGNLRGTQRVCGQIQIVNSNGTKVMVMGYAKGKF